MNGKWMWNEWKMNEKWMKNEWKMSGKWMENERKMNGKWTGNEWEMGKWMENGAGFTSHHNYWMVLPKIPVTAFCFHFPFIFHSFFIHFAFIFHSLSIEFPFISDGEPPAIRGVAPPPQDSSRALGAGCNAGVTRPAPGIVVYAQQRVDYSHFSFPSFPAGEPTESGGLVGVWILERGWTVLGCPSGLALRKGGFASGLLPGSKAYSPPKNANFKDILYPFIQG